jgi:hypothetical protein
MAQQHRARAWGSAGMIKLLCASCSTDCFWELAVGSSQTHCAYLVQFRHICQTLAGTRDVSVTRVVVVYAPQLALQDMLHA